MTDAPSPAHLLLLPRELRDEIFGYLVLPAHVYTSSTTVDTANFGKLRKAEKLYVDSRIYLPSRLPGAVLATCRQLRQECLEHQAHLLVSATPFVSEDTSPTPLSNVLAERLGNEYAEEAERACDNGLLRLTLEVQKPQRGPMGYAIPARDELSPRFLALLPLMHQARKLRLAIWPGYDWWCGGSRPLTDKYGNLRVNNEQAKKPDAASLAIGRILEHLPHVEELSIDVLMQASEGSRWDLPDKKWENIQPWLDVAITLDRGQALEKVTRRLIGFWEASRPEVFYNQTEQRQGSGRIWDVKRNGDMGTVSYTIGTSMP